MSDQTLVRLLKAVKRNLVAHDPVTSVDESADESMWELYYAYRSYLGDHPEFEDVFVFKFQWPDGQEKRVFAHGLDAAARLVVAETSRDVIGATVEIVGRREELITDGYKSNG